MAVTLLACALVVDRPGVVIGTGSLSGIYYPLGGSICRLFNLDTRREGERCVAVPSAGPVANIESLHDGRTDIGIVQSDVLADAVAGQGPFALRGPDPALRILFTGHADAFTIVARRELAIHSAAELRGMRINMGSPGSGERVSMARIMAALGVTQKDFAEVHELSLAEQHRALCANELDAIVYSVGHPNGLIQDVVRMCRGVLVDVSGPPIDDMLSRHREYERAVMLLANFGKEGKMETVVPKISQEILAAKVGTTRSRINFFMNKFRKLGLIEYNGELKVHSALLNVIIHD